MSKKEYQSFNGYGVDIGQHRADDLDRKTLEYLQSKNNAKVLDLGAGSLGQSKRIAELGISVVAVDIDDYSTEINESIECIQFIQADLKHIAELNNINGITDIVFQRTLHYVPHKDAMSLLRHLEEISSDKLFISVSGLDSEIGSCLEVKDQAIENRYSWLTKEGQDKFGITAPVCLYSENEFKDILEKSGWQIDEIWTSAFKNIKAVCSHK